MLSGRLATASTKFGAGHPNLAISIGDDLEGFQKHYLGQSSCAAELLYLYRQRNSVDAATFCVFAIALMPWLQEAESACQVQYTGKVSA